MLIQALYFLIGWVLISRLILIYHTTSKTVDPYGTDNHSSTVKFPFTIWQYNYFFISLWNSAALCCYNDWCMYRVYGSDAALKFIIISSYDSTSYGGKINFRQNIYCIRSVLLFLLVAACEDSAIIDFVKLCVGSKLCWLVSWFWITLEGPVY